MKDYILTIKSNRRLTESIFELELVADEKLPRIFAGQFLHLEVKGEHMLRRPFCIYDYTEKTIRLIVAEVGKGTASLRVMKAGEKLKAILPIGNGFRLMDKHKSVAIIAGGVGVAPLLTTNNDYPDREYKVFLGYKSKMEAVCISDYKKRYKSVYISSDDGTIGEKGFVTDAFLRECDAGYKPDIILTCGASGLMDAVKKIAIEKNIEALMSGEIRMGCGIGACLVCACAIKQQDGTTKNLRACIDGPVFNLKEVVL